MVVTPRQACRVGTDSLMVSYAIALILADSKMSLRHYQADCKNNFTGGAGSQLTSMATSSVVRFNRFTTVPPAGEPAGLSSPRASSSFV
jgi:hypothetical protein